MAIRTGVLNAIDLTKFVILGNDSRVPVASANGGLTVDAPVLNVSQGSHNESLERTAELESYELAKSGDVIFAVSFFLGMSKYNGSTRYTKLSMQKMCAGSTCDFAKHMLATSQSAAKSRRDYDELIIKQLSSNSKIHESYVCVNL